MAGPTNAGRRGVGVVARDHSGVTNVAWLTFDGGLEADRGGKVSLQPFAAYGRAGAVVVAVTGDPKVVAAVVAAVVVAVVADGVIAVVAAALSVGSHGAPNQANNQHTTTYPHGSPLGHCTLPNADGDEASDGDGEPKAFETSA
jgi:hypothetical protein